MMNEAIDGVVNPLVKWVVSSGTIVKSRESLNNIRFRTISLTTRHISLIRLFFSLLT